MAIQTGLLKQQMTGSNLYGPQTLGLFTPQNNEGLGLPGGQVSFNLPRTSPAPGTNVNFPQNMPTGYPGVSMSITRTASSDPVKNIIADIQNPLNSTNVNFKNTAGGGAGGSQGMPSLSAPAPGTVPRYDLGTLGMPGQPAGQPFRPTLGMPGVSSVNMPPMDIFPAAGNSQFSLRSRMLQRANQSLFPMVFA